MIALVLTHDGANFELKGHEIFVNKQGPIDNSFLIDKKLTSKILI